MSIKTDAELLAQIESVIVVNGNREITPPLDKAIRDNIVDSKLNIKDGGMVLQALVGYTTELTPSNNKHLTPKKYVDDKDALVVHLAGTETITGAKTFSLDTIHADTKGVTWASGSSVKDSSGTLNLLANTHAYLSNTDLDYGIHLTGTGANQGQVAIFANDTIDITTEDSATINIDTDGALNIGAGALAISATTISINGNDLTAELLPEPIGEAYNEVWADLTDWTSVGTPSASVAGGQLTIAGVASLSTNYIRCSGYGRSNVEYAKYEWTETVSTIGASSSGKAFGIQGQNADFSNALHVNLELSTTTTGRIFWYKDNDTTVIQSSNSDLSVSTADVVSFVLYRFPDRMMITATNQTTGATVTDILYFAYPRTTGVAINPPLGGQFAFFNRGGNHTVGEFTFSILDLKKSKVLFIGDSITQSTGSQNRVIAEIQKRYRDLVQCNATSGAECEDINVSEIALYEPEEICLWIGTNDIANDGLATAQTEHATLVTALDGIGYSVANGNLKFGNCLPRGSADYNTFNAYLVSTHGAANVVDFNKVVSNGTINFSTTYSADTIHPNGAGCEILAVYAGEYFSLTKNNNFYDNRYVTIHPYLNTVTLPKTTLTAGTLTDGVNGLAMTATMPTTITATSNAVDISITSAGSSSFTNRASLITYAAGYTGSSATVAIQGLNQVAGTGTTITTGVNNSGLAGNSTATTTGTNVGGKFTVSGGNQSIAVTGMSLTAKNSATNGGAAFIGRNTGSSPIQFGVYAGLNANDPTFVSAALIADNSDQTSPIFLGRDNGSVVFTIADGGNVTTTGELLLSASTTARATLNIPSGTAPSSPVNGDIWSDGSDLKVRLGGVTYTLTKV
jgi:lysophospholipase L1-like esterase